MTAINETLSLLPPAARQEVLDFAEFLAQKYQNNSSKISKNGNEILKFSGAWADMKETDYQEFVSDVYDRRAKAFVRRRQT